MVSPPPGVSSAQRVPSIASVRPRATARPRPTPSPRGASPPRWNGAKIWSLASSGTPGPRSTTRICTRSPSRPAWTTTSRRPGGVPQRVLEDVGEDPVEEAGVGPTPAGRSSSNRVRTRSPSGHGIRAASTTSSRTRSPACGEMLPVWMRDMSSRLPMRTAEPVGGLLDRLEQLGLVLGRERHVGLAQAGDRRLDPGQRGAQVVRHRGQERRPRPVVAGEAASLAGLGDQALPGEQAPRRARRTRRRGAVRRRAGPGRRGPARSRRRRSGGRRRRGCRRA